MNKNKKTNELTVKQNEIYAVELLEKISTGDRVARGMLLQHNDNQFRRIPANLMSTPTDKKFNGYGPAVDVPAEIFLNTITSDKESAPSFINGCKLLETKKDENGKYVHTYDSFCIVMDWNKGGRFVFTCNGVYYQRVYNSAETYLKLDLNLIVLVPHNEIEEFLIALKYNLKYQFELEAENSVIEDNLLFGDANFHEIKLNKHHHGVNLSFAEKLDRITKREELKASLEAKLK